MVKVSLRMICLSSLQISRMGGEIDSITSRCSRKGARAQAGPEGVAEIEPKGETDGLE